MTKFIEFLGFREFIGFVGFIEMGGDALRFIKIGRDGKRSPNDKRPQVAGRQ